MHQGEYHRFGYWKRRFSADRVGPPWGPCLLLSLLDSLLHLAKLSTSAPNQAAYLFIWGRIAPLYAQPAVSSRAVCNTAPAKESTKSRGSWRGKPK